MPQTLVPTDLTASSVHAVSAVFATLRDRDAESRPTVATACPPRLRRVVAFMSANQVTPRIDDALSAKEQPRRSPMRESRRAVTSTCG
jgi:hypothetical protein